MAKTTKIIIGAVVLIIVIFGGVKLFGIKNEKTSEPIKIGAVLALTGNNASYGQSTKKAWIWRLKN